MNALRWPEFCGDLVTGWDGVCWDSETWRTVGARCTTAAGRPIGARCVEVERSRCVGVEVERVTLVEAMPVEWSEALAVELAPFVVIVPKGSRRELWRVWRDALRSVFGEFNPRRMESTRVDSPWRKVTVEGVTVEARAVCAINRGVGRPVIPRLEVRGTVDGQRFHVSGDDARGYPVYAALAREVERARKAKGSDGNS